MGPLNCLEVDRDHPFEDELLAPDGNFYPRDSKLRPAGAADDLLVKTGYGPPISPVIPCNECATLLGVCARGASAGSTAGH